MLAAQFHPPFTVLSEQMQISGFVLGEPKIGGICP